MRIVVSGGAGRVGRFVVQELASAGHEVTSLDLAAIPGADRDQRVRYMLGNVCNAEDVYGALGYAKADAMVHMAAWSDPGIVADNRTYTENVGAAFNMLDAAEKLRLHRVIMASSAQVYGFAEHAPVFAPVTEDHPLRPLNAYALSKIAGEQAATYFSQRGLNVLSFRIMGARAPQDMQAELAKARTQPQRERFLLWTRVDARDIAKACRQALEVDRVESGIYNMSGANNVFDIDTRELFEKFAPTTDLRDLPGGKQSPFSSAKAAQAFGYRPEIQ